MNFFMNLHSSINLVNIYFIVAFSCLFPSCAPQTESVKLTVKLEQLKKNECENLCHKLKISIFNPTEDNFLLPALYIRSNLFVVDNEGREYQFSDLFSQELSYYSEHARPIYTDSSASFYDGQFEVGYDSLELFSRQHLSKNHQIFAENATNNEMKEILRKHKLNNINKDDSVYLSDLIKVKYISSALLNPKDSVYETFHINTMVGKGYKVYFKYESLNRNDQNVEIYLNDSKKTVEVRSDYPNKVNGYRLFEGVIRSDTIELR